MHDIIIKNGTLINGLETPAFKADIAINGDTITAIGDNLGEAKKVIDASGHIVTPGWVDIHTHYDAQATWDPYLTPSSFHGVTTTVMGNCGVGFAPVKADKKDWLIGLMEGVEDIPGAALTEGIQWEWETFPEYLEALKKRNYVMDIGTQVPMVQCALTSWAIVVLPMNLLLTRTSQPCMPSLKKALKQVLLDFPLPEQ